MSFQNVKTAKIVIIDNACQTKYDVATFARFFMSGEVAIESVKLIYHGEILHIETIKRGIFI